MLHPSNLSRHKRVKSFPLLARRHLVREAPKYFPHRFDEDGIAVVQYVHRHKIKTHKVENQIVDLVLRKANADQITKTEVTESFELEEERYGVLDLQLAVCDRIILKLVREGLRR
jgi:hypothetical protein